MYLINAVTGRIHWMPGFFQILENFAEFLPQASETVALCAAASSKPVNEDLYRKVNAGAFWNAGPSGSVCRQIEVFSGKCLLMWEMAGLYTRCCSIRHLTGYHL